MPSQFDKLTRGGKGISFDLFDLNILKEGRDGARGTMYFVFVVASLLHLLSAGLSSYGIYSFGVGALDHVITPTISIAVALAIVFFVEWGKALMIQKTSRSVWAFFNLEEKDFSWKELFSSVVFSIVLLLTSYFLCQIGAEKKVGDVTDKKGIINAKYDAQIQIAASKFEANQVRVSDSLDKLAAKADEKHKKYFDAVSWKNKVNAADKTVTSTLSDLAKNSASVEAMKVTKLSILDAEFSTEKSKIEAERAKELSANSTNTNLFSSYAPFISGFIEVLLLILGYARVDIAAGVKYAAPKVINTKTNTNTKLIRKFETKQPLFEAEVGEENDEEIEEEDEVSELEQKKKRER